MTLQTRLQKALWLLSCSLQHLLGAHNCHVTSATIRKSPCCQEAKPYGTATSEFCIQQPWVVLPANSQYQLQMLRVILSIQPGPAFRWQQSLWHLIPTERSQARTIQPSCSQIPDPPKNEQNKIAVLSHEIWGKLLHNDSSQNKIISELLLLPTI